MDPNRNPTDPQAMGMICFTQVLDEYILPPSAPRRKPSGTSLVFNPFFIYFGSANGCLSHLSLGTRYSSCNTCDPRIRPWYVAASRGPKNLFMVLDHSGSKP